MSLLNEIKNSEEWRLFRSFLNRVKCPENPMNIKFNKYS
jgi:hypothetical protein